MHHDDNMISPMQMESLHDPDPARPITAKWVHRGGDLGFDRRPNEREDKVVFVRPHKDTGREQLVAIISPLTLAQISGNSPFGLSAPSEREFTISAKESTRLKEWAQSGLAAKAAFQMASTAKPNRPR